MIFQSRSHPGYFYMAINSNDQKGEMKRLVQDIIASPSVKPSCRCGSCRCAAINELRSFLRLRLISEGCRPPTQLGISALC